MPGEVRWTTWFEGGKDDAALVVEELLHDDVVLEQLTAHGQHALRRLREALLRAVPAARIDPTTLGNPVVDGVRKIEVTNLGGSYTEEVAEPRPVTRTELLNRAADIIGGDRADTYGDARSSFQRIADLWHGVLGIPVSATDVAKMMVLMKVARLQHHPDHADSWLDIAGYAALGAEIAQAKL